MRRFIVNHGRWAHCAAVILLTFSPASTRAADQPTYEAKVVAPGAAVLSGPGEDFYATDTLAQGDMVEVHRGRPGGWLGIRPPADSFSWVFGRHVKLLDNGLAEVEKDDVASRIGSRMSDQRNAVQVRLKKGEIVEILGEQTIDGQTWYKIAPPAGEFRWIHARHVERTDDQAMQSTAAPPVVTVPVIDDPTAPVAAPITLVADSQPAPDDSWRAAPPGAVVPPAPDGEASEVAAPPLAAEVSSAASGAPVSDVVPNSPEAAPPLPAAEAASAPPKSAGTAPIAPVATTASKTGLVSDGLARQLTELEMRLSRIVAEPPITWQIEPLASEAQRLLAQSQTVADRSAIQTTLTKIDRFATIGRRYRQVGLVGAGPGDPRTTSGFRAPRTTSGSADPRTAWGSRGPLATDASQPGVAPITPIAGLPSDLVGPDGQRYDAVGILRPVVSKRAGAPQFALLNERGQVVSFVTPTPDVNLQPYVGRRIGVTGSRGYIPEFQRAHVTAGRVAPLSDQLLR